MGDKEFKKEN